jgi:hypothetical protein
MPSAVAKGQAAKFRTKRWFEQQGYAIAFLERVLWIQGKHGLIPVKRDQMGSDILAVNQERTVFCQVKGGESRRDQLAAARKEFAKYPLGPGCESWIVCWAPRAREPEVEVVRIGPSAPGAAVPVPPRRKPKVRNLPLFARESGVEGGRRLSESGGREG